MRALELTVDTATARSLAVEADQFDFPSIEAYLRWLVEHRFDIESDGETGTALSAYADRVRDVEAESDVAAVADAASQAATDGDDRSGERARIEDEDLAAAAAALSGVEENRLDLLAESVIAETQTQLGGEREYRSTAPLPGAEDTGNLAVDLESIEVPGWDDAVIERRREAVGAALSHLREVGEATRSDFVDALYSDHPAGYDSPGSWWTCISQGLRQVDRVDPAHEDRRVWRFRAEPGRVTRISYS